MIALSAKDGQLLWHVQPGSLAQQLQERTVRELKRADINDDGVLDELESLRAFGWDFNKFDRAASGPSGESLAQGRAASLVDALDANRDDRLSYQELKGYTRGLRMSSLDQEDKEADVEQLAAQRAAATLAETDADGDGRITREEAKGHEIEAGFRRADQRDPDTKKSDLEVTRKELLEYYAKVERGRDGRITSAELAHFFTRQYGQNLGDGKLTLDELRGYYGGYRNGMGNGPRGTPTVDGDRVYVEGGRGDVSCLDAATGHTHWHVNLREDFGGGVPGWGYSESPLVEGDLVIVTPGGRAGTMVALNKRTGDIVWKTEGETQAAHYSSPVAADIHGVRQIVQFARSSLFGVDARTGESLWSYSAANNGTANCATPVVWKNHVFASSSYGTGGGLVKIEKTGEGMKAEEVYFERKMANHHGGLVRVGEHMYGFGSGGLLCMHYLTGEIVWSHRSVGKGSLLAADGLLFLLSERHEAALAAADPAEYRELGQFSIQEHGRPSWAHPALANGVLYIRDQQSLTAYKVR